MKYFERGNYYRNSTGTNHFDISLCEARSYGHWRYVKMENNQLVFNRYKYSVTTSKHQREMLSLLDALGIKVDRFVDQRESL